MTDHQTTGHHPPSHLGPDHVAHLRAEWASEDRDLPADWPSQIVRRAATLMTDRAAAAKTSYSGRWVVRPGRDYPQEIADNASAVIVADTFETPPLHPFVDHITGFDPHAAIMAAEAWAQQADDMATSLAHLHPFGRSGDWVVVDERESPHFDWTATLCAALAYLREDAPAVTS